MRIVLAVFVLLIIGVCDTLIRGTQHAEGADDESATHGKTGT